MPRDTSHDRLGARAPYPTTEEQHHTHRHHHPGDRSGRPGEFVVNPRPQMQTALHGGCNEKPRKDRPTQDQQGPDRAEWLSRADRDLAVGSSESRSLGLEDGDGKDPIGGRVPEEHRRFACLTARLVGIPLSR